VLGQRSRVHCQPENQIVDDLGSAVQALVTRRRTVNPRGTASHYTLKRLSEADYRKSAHWRAARRQMDVNVIARLFDSLLQPR